VVDERCQYLAFGRALACEVGVELALDDGNATKYLDELVPLEAGAVIDGLMVAKTDDGLLSCESRARDWARAIRSRVFGCLHSCIPTVRT